MTKEEKGVIDNMSYETMLRKWRFAPSGDPIFIGPRGEYFQSVMGNKEDKLQPGEKTEISKRIGWNN